MSLNESICQNLYDAPRKKPDSLANSLGFLKDPNKISIQQSSQFWEFCQWESTILEKEGESFKKWWKNHLRGTKALQLKGMNENQNSNGWSKSVSIRIPIKIKQNVQEASSKSNVTLFAVWQGMFAIWCWKMMDVKGESELKDDVLIVGRVRKN